MARALFVLLAGPIVALSPAHAQAQTGAIQVAPVMVALSGERNIASVRIRNGRPAPIAFEVDAYEWRQEGGRDVLTPSDALLVAPGVFEIPARSEQVIRLGVARGEDESERAYRLLLRELPRARGRGVGFSLELSLPVFVAPEAARGDLLARVDMRAWGPVLTIANPGRAHLVLLSVSEASAGALEAPRYLLAGASAEIPLSAEARTITLIAADSGGAQTEQVVHVRGPDRQHASGR